jgi:HAD superfamily hydrolase (TIGR01484 family)
LTPRMIALDIDGTLVDPYEHVSPEVHAAVHRALDAGVDVVLSTGRSVYGIGRLIDALDLGDGIAVASNGAVTFTYAPIDIGSAVTFDPRQAVELLLERVPDALVAVEVIGRGYRVNRPFPQGEITGEMWLQSVDELVADPVTRVIIRDPSASAEEFVEIATTLGLAGTNYFVGYTAWLDLAPEGVSKASALADIAKSLNVDRSEVLAIGDGRNDISMLQWAGRGVAMGQAPSSVREAADDVTGSLADDGVAVELDRWFSAD